MKAALDICVYPMDVNWGKGNFYTTLGAEHFFAYFTVATMN